MSLSLIDSLLIKISSVSVYDKEYFFQDSLNFCSRFAEITILVGTVVPIWSTLCMTEAIAVKAAMATKFKYMGGINDYFFGHFLFVANLGFAIGSAFGMYHLGSLQLDIIIFSGEGIETEAVVQIFMPVFVSVTLLITGISGTVLTLKKNVEERKDQRILNNICVNLDKKCDRVQEINNIKFNQPILKNIDIFAICLTVIGLFVGFLILEWMESSSFTWFVLAAHFFISIALPCIGLLKQDHFNAFFWRTLYDILLGYCHGIVRGLSRCGGKTQTITKPTGINLVAEVNAIPMPTAYPTVCQFLQDIPSLEDTSFRLRSIPSIVHFTSFTAHRRVAPFIQELPPIEDPDQNISESPTNASVNALVDVIVHQEAEG